MDGTILRQVKYTDSPNLKAIMKSGSTNEE